MPAILCRARSMPATAVFKSIICAWQNGHQIRRAEKEQHHAFLSHERSERAWRAGLIGRRADIRRVAR